MSAKPFTFQNPPAFLEKSSTKPASSTTANQRSEIFNPGMFGVIQWYTDRGLPGPCHFQYVLVQGGLPAVPKSVFELEEYRKECSRTRLGRRSVLPKAICPCIFTALALGGGIRVGLRIPGFCQGFWRTTRCWCSAQPARKNSAVSRPRRMRPAMLKIAPPTKLVLFFLEDARAEGLIFLLRGRFLYADSVKELLCRCSAMFCPAIGGSVSARA